MVCDEVILGKYELRLLVVRFTFERVVSIFLWWVGFGVVEVGVFCYIIYCVFMVAVLFFWGEFRGGLGIWAI